MKITLNSVMLVNSWGLSRIGFFALRLVAVLALVVGTTFFCLRLIPVNSTTVALGYLVGILVIATAWGFWEAFAASLAAVVCLNFFFMPPTGTFTIADPQNWVALFAFLATALVASQLSSRAKQRTEQAVARQLEMERLYALSRAILLTDATQPAAKQIAHQVAQIFDCRALALYVCSSGETYRAGPEDMPALDDKLQQAALQGTFFSDESSLTMVTAIRLGGQPIGSLAIRGATLPDTALQALASLVAIALEKERGQEAASRAEAARQSEELKSTLLDAIAHEFKTPLTSIKAAATALLSTPAAGAQEQHELVTIVDEEVDHLNGLVSEAIQMARIEAGKIQLNRGLHAVGDLIGSVLQQMKAMTEGRSITVSVAADLPMVLVDGELLVLALRQLLDNAVKYSAPASSVAVRAEKDDGGVAISISDEGPGIPEREQSRVFERFYRSRTTRQHVTGTGMGLAIAQEIVRAHGGEIRVESKAGCGSRFIFSLPAAPQGRAA